MHSAEWIGLLVVLVILGFQARTTLKVWRSKLFDRSQKIAQSQLIWLLPLIGAVIVMSVLDDEDQRDKGPPPGLGR